MFYNKSLIAAKLRRWEKYLNNYTLPKWDELPTIDLYMDQVIALLNQYLDFLPKDDVKDEKIVTPVAINNYVRMKIMPAPVKKKYSKDHMLMLIFIYYFKSLLSFNDIEELFRPITSRHFTGKDSPLSLEDIYTEVFTLEKGEMGSLMKDVTGKFARSRKTFQDVSVDEEDKEYLQLFAFICELSFDVYLKTQMIEMIADQLRGEATPPRKK